MKPVVQLSQRRLALSGISIAAVLAMTPALAQEKPGRDYSKIPDGAYSNIPDGAYSIVAQVRAKPGKESELRAATLPLVALVRGDPNNLVYFLQEDRSTPGHFIFYEVSANKEDFEAHNATPYVRAWLARLPELSDGASR